MGLLNKHLTKLFRQRYSEEASVERKIDLVIKDFVPEDIRKMGLDMSISWSLKNLKLSDIDGALQSGGESEDE